MGTRGRTSQHDEVEVQGAPTDRGAAGRRWIRTLLHREEQEDDGVFRPVRLPLWTDLGLSAGIVVLVVGSFGGVIYFLAQTQGR